MNEAVFISDLHLNPHEPDILERFERWVDWALFNTRSVYILGDFFHAWAGDDTIDAWSKGIADQLYRLSSHKIAVYFIHGNRDFLLGLRFAREAGIILLTEPFCFTLNHVRVLLVHGDRYCTEDKAHQWFRRLTRNRLFVFLFLKLPKRWRMNTVARVRQYSQNHSVIDPKKMEIDIDALSVHAQQHQADVLIHGHTHRPQMIKRDRLNHQFQHIILSDWDELPHILCYNISKGFYFNLMLEENKYE
jgi:UDP-2,3-diacylglucosamine hydrolase